MDIHKLGWNNFFESQFHEWRSGGRYPARVAEEHRGRYVIITEEGACAAEVSGRFRHRVESRSRYPCVGDWVAAASASGNDRGIIHGVLERKSAFSRKGVCSGGMPDTGGRTEEQVLAANIDTVFLVGGLDGDFNVRRMERYLAAAWDSGATPVVLLNKADICPDVGRYVEEIESIAFGVPIHIISAAEETEMESLDTYLGAGMTSVFLGSSGVGKSTIINCLLHEERLKTTAVREADSRGRHTTTYRQMILLPGGGIVIDTPGMRELQPWDSDDGVGRTFEDVEQLAAQCRFNDCSHQTEPGCAIRNALDDGTLGEKRFDSYQKLLKEKRFLAMRKDQAAQRRFVRAWDKRIRQHLQVKKDLKKKGLL